MSDDEITGRTAREVALDEYEKADAILTDGLTRERDQASISASAAHSLLAITCLLADVCAELRQIRVATASRNSV